MSCCDDDRAQIDRGGHAMREFKDRVAVVTGAASGVGYAMAERFAAAGMKVVLADVEDAALARAASALQAKGARTLAVRTDVAKAADVSALAEKTLSTFGVVHIVCNNAGVGGEPAPVWEQTLESWRWVIDVNLWGVIHGIRTFVPILLQQGTEGHIVNTASMAGHISLPMMSVYHATKFAVVTISETLHLELAMMGAQVKASVLCPGFVRTNIMDSQRNRPDELRTPDRPITEAEQAMQAAFDQFVAAGMPPAEVATRVFEAIRDERFYIFSHPDFLAAIRSRMQTILA
ncbi:MAG: SDR family NAD(P)-dependent oxidoreductase, partial [Gaiellaceae bacterium]